MKIISILVGLIIFQINPETPIFIFSFEESCSESNGGYRPYRCITKDNWERINVEEVKHLRYVNLDIKSVPKEIKHFNFVEELDLYTSEYMIHAHGVGLIRYYHHKGSLKTLPNWLTEFKKLKKINLDGQLQLKMDKTIHLLAQIENLEEITIEINKNEISSLKQLTEIKNLKKVNVGKSNLTDSEKEKISKILVNQKFEFEIKDIDRKPFKR